MRVALGTFFFAALSASFAQVPPRLTEAEQTAVKLPTPISSFKVQLGAIKVTGPDSAASAIALEQRYFSSGEPVNVREILKGSGVTLDNATLASLKRLNPKLGSDGTLPAGVKFTYFAPEIALGATIPDDAAQHIDMSAAAQLAVRSQVSEAARLNQDALILDERYQFRKADAARHQMLTRDIDVTAKLVVQRAARMSARDLALSRFYLQSANHVAGGVVEREVPLGPGPGFYVLSSSELDRLQKTVKPLQTMQSRMLSDQSPFGDQTVTVSVTTAPNATAQAKLRVYVLPVGLMYSAGLVSEDQIRQLLIELTFDQLTTPSTSTLPQAELAVWVGPDHAYDAMAKLVVASGRTIAFKPARGASGTSNLELTFQAPDEVVLP